MDNANKASIVAGMGTSANKSNMSGGACFVKLTDFMKTSYVQSSNKEMWYKNSDSFLKIPSLKVNLKNIFEYDDNIDCNITKCSQKNCKLCSILITDTEFKSNLTNKTYRTQSFDNLNCKSSNIIYGIECNLCGLIYVGETMDALNKRISGHRFEINHGGKQLLYQHFNQKDHSILSMKVRIIEKIYHHTNNKKLSTPLRRNREESWIRKLGTATPYGCNDKIDSIGNLTSPNCSSTNVFKLFEHSTRRKRSHGHRHYTPPRINDITFHNLLDHINSPLGVHYIRTKLFSLSLSSLHCLHNDSVNRYIENIYSKEYRLNNIILDIGHHRLYKPVKSISTEEKRSFLKVKFANKGLDAINLSNILNNKNVKSKVPPYFKEHPIPIVSYSYTRSIASKIFNYKTIIRSVNIKDIKSKPPSCSCQESRFCYSPSGHVITGDLDLIPNAKLRNIIRKGPKYRIPNTINWKYNFKLLMDAVEDHARKWVKREEVNINCLSEWIKTIRDLIYKRFNILRTKFKPKTSNIFNDENVMNCLTSLQSKFVIVPADKAPNNIIFVCKKYYVQCLLNELGVNTNSHNNTYTLETLSKQEILNNQMSVLSSFGIDVNKEDHELPSLYWLPKMHKTPYKQRYIAGSYRCSTKPISKKLTKILTGIKEGLQKYCETAYSRSGINQMWILKNSKSLLESLKSRALKNVTSISTYDFSTLYTTIPHSTLKSRLEDLITRSFFNKNGTRRYKYIVVNEHNNSTYFVKEYSNANNKYTEGDIISMINFLIDNIYVELGGQIFRQTIGIPMGTNCAPLLADLFLYSYEAEFIQQLLANKKKNIAQKFNHTFRYIDDVLSLSNPSFGNYLHQIYPDELNIKNTTDTNHSASYLDLMLKIDHNKVLTTKLYDKRDDFDFSIVNFPFLDSNIPSSPAYGVYMSQLIRYARACSNYNDFSTRCRTLNSKLITQGYIKTKLKVTTKKFCGRHSEIFNKFTTSVSKFIADVL